MAEALKMTIAELETFLERDFPQVGDDFAIDHLDPDSLRVRLRVGDRHLRPGGTVSGPSMFALADVAIYLAILSRLGPVALAVTTNCSIDFMRKPARDADLVCEARLLKLGRQLAVGDAMLFSDGQPQVVARAGLTYAIPPAPKQS
ncbi:PaaI family thioesterase [Actibacterium sp. 188UL27-1]|uniref:PaaI family thioesterase n=1 Tax=Actibacterium sp. 188UL27-1 TaxID=2786961 RepID=UPI00195D1924|nr:PaaI family thioesterase [Actibacterium sp. 188UL27-1]MBM7067584.1 PaaI family thioesterase [Actibacterium sp. 188UL27-1]